MVGLVFEVLDINFLFNICRLLECASKNAEIIFINLRIPKKYHQYDKVHFWKVPFVGDHNLLQLTYNVASISKIEKNRLSMRKKHSNGYHRSEE